MHSVIVLWSIDNNFESFTGIRAEGERAGRQMSLVFELDEVKEGLSTYEVVRISSGCGEKGWSPSCSHLQIGTCGGKI